MEELRQFSFWRYKVFGWMFSSFGAAALLLASIGVYGVLAYSVSQRTQEIGVRVALGAGRNDVMRLVVGQGVKLAALGIAVGVAGALGVTPIIKGLLYNVTASDPLSFSLVAMFLTIVAVVASYVPARRAMAVDPIIALRNE
jgi:putative ABC transport system permease protein